jgi:hypothetical protein
LTYGGTYYLLLPYYSYYYYIITETWLAAWLDAQLKPETARTGKETKYKAASDANGLELIPNLSLLVVAGARRVMISSKKY